MNWFQKLRTEWKTAALAIAGTVVGGYDVVVAVAQQYGYDYTQLIKAEYRLYVIPAFAVSMLALRKWVNSTSVEIPPIPDVPEVSDPEVK